MIDGYRRELRDVAADTGRTFFLAMHYPPEALIDAAARHGDDLNRDLFPPVALLAKRAKRLLREFVPSFYAGLPLSKDESGHSLVEALFPGDPTTWWLTDISEKSIFRGRLIARLYSLALLREAIAAHRPTEIWLALSDEDLSNVIAAALGQQYDVRIIYARPWLSKCKRAIRAVRERVGYPCRALVLAWGTLAESMLLKLIAGPCAGFGASRRHGRRVALFSFFPSWWRNAWDEDRREVFYQGLPRRLTSSGFEVRNVVWLRLGLLDFLRNAARMRRLCRSGNFLCLQSLCEFRKSVELLGFKALMYCLRVLRIRLNSDAMTFAGFGIGGLVREELLRSVSNRELFRNLLLRSAAEKLSDIDLLLFRIEFQPFERAIIQGSRARHVATLGYQHSSVGEDYLSHLFAPGQLQGGMGGNVTPLPVPDHIVTTGRHVAQLMLANGFQQERVHIGGPLRYQELRLRLRDRRECHSTKDGKGRYALLVPVSLDHIEAMGFAAVLAEALIGMEDRFTVDIKGHPANDHAGEFLSYLLRKSGAIMARLVPDNMNLYDYISEARALVMTGSTVGLEAIALGTPVIMFVNGHIFSFTASSLNAVEQAVVSVDDAASLRQALKQLYEEDTPFPEARRYWPEAVRTMFHDLDLDPEERFCSIVNGILEHGRDATQLTTDGSPGRQYNADGQVL